MQALRFFVGEPVWTPHNRPNDHLPARCELINSIVLDSLSIRDSEAFLSILIIWFLCADNNMSRILWKRMLATMLLMPPRKIWFCLIIVPHEKDQDFVAKVRFEKKKIMVSLNKGSWLVMPWCTLASVFVACPCIKIALYYY